MPSHNSEEYLIQDLAQRARTIIDSTPCVICNNVLGYNRIIANANNYPMIICVHCINTLEYLQTSTHVVDYFQHCLCPVCDDRVLIHLCRWLGEDGIICEHCYYTNSWECYYCHSRYSENTEYFTTLENEDDTHFVCNYCHNNNADLILPYSYDPKFKFYKTDRDKRELLYFGIELEVESNGNDKRDAIESLPDCVYIKSDSSIMDGFEIISHPMTYNWLMDNYKVWDKILDLRKSGWRSYDTESCGMHIHLSKNAFGHYHLFKFMKLFYDNHDFVLQFSQRKGNHLNCWASLEDSEKNIIYKARHKHIGRENRHTAINLSRDFSVEVRIFRGTLNPPSFWKNIEFTKAVFDFSRDYPLESMHEIEFRNFVRFERKRYPNLHSFIWDKDKMKYTMEV